MTHMITSPAFKGHVHILCLLKSCTMTHMITSPVFIRPRKQYLLGKSRRVPMHAALHCFFVYSYHYITCIKRPRKHCCSLECRRVLMNAMYRISIYIVNILRSSSFLSEVLRCADQLYPFGLLNTMHEVKLS